MSDRSSDPVRLLNLGPAVDGSNLDSDREASPLDLESLTHLYDRTDWRVVLLDDEVDREYGEPGIAAVSMFKALALPYVINIPTERALGRELEERKPLQRLCGFCPGARIPSRETIWHFRNKYADVYPDIMLKVLIAMVLSDKSPNLDLPFVRAVADHQMPPDGLHQVYEISKYQPKIEVWRTVDTLDAGEVAGGDGPTRSTEYWEQKISEAIRCNDNWAKLRERIAEIQEARKRFDMRSRERIGFVGELGLPVEVKTRLRDETVVRFEIVEPVWVDVHSKVMDSLTVVGPATRERYAACSIIVIREHESRQQVLLSRRLTGFAEGMYMLPGGKQLAGESLCACAARELKEETGIRMLESRPVSVYHFRLPGKPPVLSVGVLATDYRGKPRLREPNQNTTWEWYDLDSSQLPRPLFLPTRVAINQYVEEIYPDLQWSDVEAQVRQLEERPHQLGLAL